MNLAYLCYKEISFCILSSYLLYLHFIKHHVALHLVGLKVGPTSIALVNGVQVFLVTGAKSICINEWFRSQCGRSCGIHDFQVFVQFCATKIAERYVYAYKYVHVHTVCSYVLRSGSTDFEPGLFYISVATFV